MNLYLSVGIFHRRRIAKSKNISICGLDKGGNNMYFTYFCSLDCDFKYLFFPCFLKTVLCFLSPPSALQLYHNGPRGTSLQIICLEDFESK